MYARGTSGFAGREHSEESIAKMRGKLVGKVPWNKGKTMSNSFKAKAAARWQAESNPNWAGGVTPGHKLFRKSARYADWRRQVFQRDDFTCQDCRARGVNLNADHIKPFSTHPELRLAVDNGRTLCLDCHRKTPTWGRKAPKELSLATRASEPSKED